MCSLCIVTTLQAPLHETLMFVNYHLNIGVDHLYLFFDDPTDAAADALVQRRRVTCVRCDLEYWNGSNSPTHRSINERQRVNAHAGLDLARRAGFDWIVHMDSDELLHSEKRLDERLAEVPREVHALKFPTMEGWSTGSNITGHSRRFRSSRCIRPAWEGLCASPRRSGFGFRVTRPIFAESCGGRGYWAVHRSRQTGTYGDTSKESRPFAPAWICKAWVATNRFAPPKALSARVLPMARGCCTLIAEALQAGKTSGKS